MLSSIFRDEIIYWNFKSLEKDKLTQTSDEIIDHNELTKSVTLPEANSNEIFRNEESVSIIECF